MVKSLELRAQRITSADVARFIGVSQATVSRAFSPNSSITDLTRGKVFEAARQLNYVPNSMARSLITRQSNIIAVLVGDLRNPFYTQALDAFSRRLQGLGKQVLVFNGATADAVDDAVRRMLEYQVDGLIITSATISMQVSALCLEREIPVVMFNRYVPGFTVSSVCCDNRAGGALAADTLVASGARRYGVIHGDSGATTSVDRARGFLAKLESYGIRGMAEEGGHYTYDGGYAAATALLSGQDPPDGLFCVNDVMALGALDAARVLGRPVPDELMVIGFDDIVEAARPPYRLTTIRQPLDEMIDAAIELLSQPPGMEPHTRIISGTLVTRATTRPAPPRR